MLMVGRRHVERVMGRVDRAYNQARPHRTLNVKPIARSDPVGALQAVRCRPRLGGLLREYSCTSALQAPAA
jgi:hypothetical protein